MPSQLQNVIERISPESLTAHFQSASDHFRPGRRDRSHDLAEDQDLLESLEQLGEIEFATGETLIVLAGKITGDMTRRRSRSAQYAVARKIIKQNFNDAAIFVFYDDEGRFRFSLITASYSGRRRKFSTFKRYTYYIAPGQPNGTFLRQIGQCGFDSVDSILQAFSVEAVSKEFYTEIAKLFTDLVGGKRKIGSKTYKRNPTLRFPNTNDTQRKEFAVRLIGRLVFCWFLKKKTSEAGVPLIPEEILSSAALAGTQRYYHNVLEPLFFETLDKEKALRHKNFRDKHWDTIPFLNGGLFEYQPSDFYEFDDVTGLSAKYANILDVSDQWLAHLLEVFDRYNFTIDESSPLDIEVAVDPEILGRIFENLLAEINPETGETARKSTGSYYTPRQIVEYMVHESLKQYLLSCTNMSEDKINSLLSYDYSDNPLTDKQTEIVIDRLHKIKIIDPACGSGAFPMGILQKIILALEKLDPDGARWKERILGEISDPTYRNALKDKLDKETWQYIHKLGVIRTSIYGVDIQPIAVEIAKLRAFLSLVVDETVNDRRKNRGIEPLPNLEFKFVCANTLINLGDTPGSGSKLFDTGPVEQYKQQLKTLRDDYFTCLQKDKPKIIADFTATQKQLLEYIIDSGLCGKDGLKSELALKLSGWKPFENEPSDWFNPDWMFGITDGFDIVIANPPYIDSENMTKTSPQLRQSIRASYSMTKGNWDIYIAFYEKGFRLLCNEGVLSFITPDKWISKPFGDEMRIRTTDKIFSILKAGREVFKSANVDAIVSVFTQVSQPFLRICDYIGTEIRLKRTISKSTLKLPYVYDWLFTDFFELLVKIDAYSGKLTDLGVCENACATSDAYKLQEFIEEEPKHAKPDDYLRIINTGTIGKYVSKWGLREMVYLGGRYTRPVVNKKQFLIAFQNSYGRKAVKRKLILKGLNLLDACLDSDGSTIPGKTTLMISSDHPETLKLLLAIVNSSVAFFYLKEKYPASSYNQGTTFTKKMLNDLPLPEIAPAERAKLISIVDCILDGKHRDVEMDTTALERQINRLIYSLYGLTDKEIAIVEGNNS